MTALEHERVEFAGETFSPTLLEGIADRLRSSSNPDLAGSIPIGFHHGAETYPVVIPESYWQHHFWCLGATRSGKTSKFVLPLLVQRIRHTEGPLNGPVVIGDLKGDDVLFHAIRLEAERQGRPFLYYTNVRQHSTYLFNPLSDRNFESLSIPQFVQVVLNALNLWHGFGYGRGHFSALTRRTLLKAMNFQKVNATDYVITHNTPRVQSFTELQNRIGDVLKGNHELSSAQELLAVIEDVASVFQMNFTDAGLTVPQEALDAAIQVPKLFIPDENGKYPVVYFYLRAGDELAGASQVMKLFVYALKNARQHLVDLWKAGKYPVEPPVVPLCLDEFGVLADGALNNLLEQAGGLGIHLILSNQDPSQLKKPNLDLLPTVWENCGNKIIFTARDTDFQDRLIKASGEKTVHMASYQVSHRAFHDGNVTPEHAVELLNGSWQTIQMQEQRAPVLERNHIVEMSNDSRRCIYISPQGESVADYGGYPILVDTDFFHSKPQYEVLRKLPWPEPRPETIIPELLSSETSQRNPPNDEALPPEGGWL